MSSHHYGGCRMPSNDPFSDFSEVSQPGTANPGIACAPRLPRSHIARPVNYTPQRSRASSASAAEETGSTLAPVPRPTSRANRRLSMLPRPSTGGSLPSVSPAPLSPQIQAQPVLSSFSISDLTSPPAFMPVYQVPPAKRPRNVLRRKAATIGKNAEPNESQKLSLVIPQTSQPNDIREPRWPTFGDADSAGPSASSSGTKEAETPTIGPAELASLRTIIDTRNLPPPPTPFFPSASTPSTRYSESPGVWSRGSTPTSLSSYSPGITQSSKIGRLRQPSPSQTRLPVFTPPTAYPSPQSASSELSDAKLSKSVIPQRSHGPSPSPGAAATSSTQRRPSTRSIPTKIQGPPHSPPPRKSSVNFSPSKNSDIDIDVEKARKEVEEAERELLNSHRAPAAPSITEPIITKTPPRPSRDGTHRLELEASPVIHSNLPYLKSTGHKRRESAEKVRSAAMVNPMPNPSAATSVDSVGSNNLTRIPSREAGSPVLARKSPKTLTKEPPKEKTDPKRAPTPKRFGLFPKKSKPELDEPSDDPTRQTRKGPAAGTGHEGYGKYGQRGRKSSASSSGTRTRSTSTTRSTPRSVASSKGGTLSRPDLDLDEFLSSRLEPVVISGGGLDGATLSRTQSELSMSSISVTSSNPPRPTPLTSSTVQSSESLATSTGAFSDYKTPSESSSSLGLTQTKISEKKPVASERQNVSKSRMPVPKGKTSGLYANSEAATSSAFLSGHGSSSAPSQNPRRTSNEKPDPTPQHKEPAKQEGQLAKKGKPSLWHLFQKNRGNERSTAPTPAPTPTPVSHAAQLHAAISPVLNNRSVAHYAFVDTDSDELDDILNKIEGSPPTEEEEVLVLPAVPAGLSIKKRLPSVLLPSPPKMHAEFEKDERPSPRTAMFNGNLMDREPESSPVDRRPRRLASVGRIPQVVSSRDRQHKPTMHSFSRPFSVAESPSLMAPLWEGSNGFPPSTEPAGKLFADVPISQSMPWQFVSSPTFKSPERSALDLLSGPYSGDEFIHFSPRNGSQSSSSSGALAAVTAVVPRPNTAPTEDEVWNEYDDLIDHVLSPEEPKPDESNVPEEEGKFELANMAHRALQDELNTDPSRLGTSNSAETLIRDSSDSVRLRRSRIVSALHSPLAPSTQPSYSDLISSYGHFSEENLNSPAVTVKAPLDSVREQQSTFLQSLATVPTPTKAKSSENRKSVPCSAERDWDAVTRTNMRSASLMTSRWLSFGRVLFSPAHNHVKTGSHGRILVIDGLGNDDWSFYCSLTYPDAEVYSLSRRPVSTALPHPAAWQPPTNHHTVYHAGLHNPLPFPKDYFTVAVLRFPAASPEHVQSNIIHECKRVLRTGGYLEMSILDRDMVNMGARTRKAVRRLKEQTYLANSSISLKPTSDSVQRLIGSQGFDNLRRCMVRIPVAGMVVRSSDSTISSSNRSLSATGTTASTGLSLPTISVTTTGSQGTQTGSKSSPSEDNISLGDLLSDPSPSPANDESIAKIVARVGRWWYTKCYEDPVLPDTGDNDPSMWNDRKVLRECQKRGSGFRMLIAYAQKPSEVKRRTASV
ncbi:uncharacterized protein N7498_009633 [Penicillium cinerascens]|uniref:Methyltransferase type 11 domain-containing protein n=1 Tax=Penicillium cinerascens TaxID=70096 RepID=A0A9W9J4U6_9EURO|nr:uncharacterized protein N7498_009633 [Penicillium cinerascens]KAJ5190648.1 hypothetical protein N7498_009633 [Penicillium cinerascens]